MIMTAASDERALREDQSDHKNHQQQREDPHLTTCLPVLVFL